MVISANPDFVMWLSTQLKCIVVGAGAETVSGSFWFTAADRGVLRRLHWDDTATLTGPFDLGDRLESEAKSLHHRRTVRESVPPSRPSGSTLRSISTHLTATASCGPAESSRLPENSRRS